MTATPDRPLWQKAMLPSNQQELGWTWVSISIIFGFIGLVLGLVIQIELFAPEPQIFSRHFSFDQATSQFSTISVLFCLMPLFLGGILNLLLPSIIGSNALEAKRLATSALWLFLAMTVVYILASALDTAPKNDGWTIYPPLSIPGKPLDFSGNHSSTGVAPLALSMAGIFCALLLCTLQTAITIGLNAKRSRHTIAMVLIALVLPANAIFSLLILFDSISEFFINLLFGYANTVTSLGPVTTGYLARVFEHVGKYSLVFPAILSYFLLTIGNLNFRTDFPTRNLAALGLGYLIILYLCWIFPSGVFLLGTIFLIGMQIWIIRNQSLSISWIWLASLPVIFAGYIYGINNLIKVDGAILLDGYYRTETYDYMIFCLFGVVAFSFFWWAIYRRSSQPFIRLMGSLHFWVTFNGILITLYVKFIKHVQLPRGTIADYTSAVEFSSKTSSIGVLTVAAGLPFLIAAAIYAKKHGGADQNSVADIFS